MLWPLLAYIFNAHPLLLGAAYYVPYITDNETEPGMVNVFNPSIQKAAAVRST